MLTGALDSRRRALGDDHPDTLTPINDMGVIFDVRGEWEAAERSTLRQIGRKPSEARYFKAEIWQGGTTVNEETWPALP